MKNRLLGEYKKTCFSLGAIYIQDRMRMYHVYQPVMLRQLLQQRGTAKRRDIAQALLAAFILVQFGKKIC